MHLPRPISSPRHSLTSGGLVAAIAAALFTSPADCQGFIKPMDEAGKWRRISTGYAGTAGIPQLATTRALLGKTLVSSLSSARPKAPMALIIGLSRMDLPIWGSRVVPQLDVLILTTTNAKGHASFKLPLPPDPGFAGTQLYAQALIEDPAANFGMAFTGAWFGKAVPDDPSFAAPVRIIQSDQTPGPLATGMLDADRLADFAVGGHNEDLVRIKYGNGNGGFNKTIVRPTGDFPSDVEVGDFNGDGKPDLITTNYNDKLIRIRWGHTTNFSGWSQWVVGNNPWQVAVGDLNGDGLDDFVTANWGTKDLSVRLRKASGGFAKQTVYTDVVDPRDVQLGDFDGDGDLDMVYTHNTANNARLRIRKNNGSGVFGAPANIAMGGGAGNTFHSIGVGDFDKDGKLDIIAARTPKALVRVLGNGDGTFSGLDVETSPVHDFPYRVYLRDLDTDGNLDLLVSHLGEGIVVYRGLGNGNASGPFQYKTATTSWCRDVAVADFDRDGKPDLVLTGNDGVYVRLANW